MTTTPSITASQIKDIKIAFATLKPQKVIVDGNRSMTVKEAVFALAPTLERMRKRGFDITELVEKLHEKGVPVKAPTLAKYLNEFRRGKTKIDTPPPPVQIEKTTSALKPDRPTTVNRREFTVTPDTPLEDL